MEENKSNVFRQRSIDRISSPEQLTDYLRVTNPGIWALLAAVIFLLGGLFAWSMAGSLDTLAEGVAVVEDGQASIVTADSSVRSGMTVRFGNKEYDISAVETDDPSMVVAYAPVDEADGRYDVKIVTESIHPIKFLFS
ncbi:hypothetical protein [Ruminococcus sp.]|uniref:hypothetical protein n=1 Tax=Ruminococcus sp. TaxID=41978 RepID=UPI0025F9BEC8|nr:hypothetical protein [Ruminococcus sp.]MBQ8967170.1 hypothetical protein [Ruminococcus sp.]